MSGGRAPPACGGEVPALVFDVGSGWTKAGVAGEDAPRALFSTVIGTPKHQGVMVGMGISGEFIGDEAQSKRGILKLKSPVEQGVVNDWDAMEKLLRHIYTKELEMSSKDHAVLLTDAPLTPKAQREKTTQVMFETFECPAMYIGIQGVLSLYAAGRTTGLAIDSGYDLTQTVPVVDGYGIKEGYTQHEMGGQQLTHHLSKLLGEQGLELTSDTGLAMVDLIKEKLCYVAEDFDAEMCKPVSAVEDTYELPGGDVITVGRERFRCPEALFNPTGTGRGLPEIIDAAISKCDMQIRGQLHRSCVVSGGNTMFPGLKERLQARCQGTVVAPPERRFSVWIGGSILASLSTFQTLWISKQEYEETGPAVVHKKCF